MTELEQEIEAVKQAAQDEATNRLLMEMALDQRVAESLVRIFSGDPHAPLWKDNNYQYQVLRTLSENIEGPHGFEDAVVRAIKSKLN